jgi:hypothetical protein
VSQSYSDDGPDIDIEIEIQAAQIEQELATSPTFIAAIALKIRDEEIKKFRAMGNGYGRTAQRRTRAETPVRRIF